MKTALILLSLLIFPYFLTTAGKLLTKNVGGKIVDQETLQPIYGVNVSLSDDMNPIGTITNEKGEFRLWNLPATSTDIVISIEGYKTTLISIQNLKDSANDKLLIKLQENHKNDNQLISVVKKGVGK